MEKDMNMTVETTVETGGEVQELAAPEVNEQVAQAQETQPTAGVKTEKDSFYADMRRKQELETTREKYAQLEKQLEAANNALGAFFEGNTLQERMDNANAQALGVDVSKIVADREAREKISSLEQQLEQYRAKDITKQMSDDLAEIKAIDPSITSLEDLPQSFIALRFNSVAPMSAKEAFIAVREIEKQTKQPKPPSMGSMTGTGSHEAEFFTNEELNKLTKAQLSDPKIMEKAKKSMARLK